MSISAELKDKIKSNINKLTQHGVDYVDVRYYSNDDLEELILADGNLETNRTVFESGIGVRVLSGGAWGFAAASDISSIDDCFDLAERNANTASKLVKIRLDMGQKPAHNEVYSSPIKQDYFDIPLKDKLDFLKSIDDNINDSWIVQRLIRVQFQRSKINFFNSEGTEIERNIRDVFAHMEIAAIDKDGQAQKRSHDLFTKGDGTRGYEMFQNPELFSSQALRIKSELKELLNADELQFGRRSVIILPGQGFLQVHETIGHPLELDRILGYELSYAGGSFVTLDSFGKLRYGSEKLSVSAGGDIMNSPGTFGFDDEGTKEGNYLLIDKGILVNAISSRSMISEANQKAGFELFKNSGGCARSTAFYRAPIDRMSNVNILPGNDGNLEDIIASTEDGIIVDTPLSWSIGSNREHFHFACEIAWEVKNGKRTRMLRNPSYQGHTLDFYNKVSAVGNSSTWEVWQVDNCGKGEPNQALELGHGVPVFRVDNVITGERE